MVTLFLFLFLLHFSISQSKSSIQPTIVNATGAYFIANGSSTFAYETIECNSSLSDNCYVICEYSSNRYEYACEHTIVKCSSNQCIFECNQALSCRYISIDVSYSNHVELYCPESDSCFRLEQFIGPKNINASVNIECNKDGSCAYSNFTIPSADTVSIFCNNTDYPLYGACGHMILSVGSNTNENQWNSNNIVSLQCIGYESCQDTDIHLSNTLTVSIECNNYYACGKYTELSFINIRDTILHCMFSLSCYQTNVVASNYNSHLSDKSSVFLNCTDGCNNLKINTANGINIFNVKCISCQKLSLIVSPLANHTNIISDKTSKLYDVSIYVSRPYQQRFFHSIFGDVSNYSFINIQCIENDNIYYIVNCTDYTSFPILDIAIPSIVNESGIYYIANEPYFYRYKQLMFSDYQQSYYVYCNYDNGCAYSLSVCESTNNVNCSLFCNGYNSCAYNVIYGPHIPDNTDVLKSVYSDTLVAIHCTGSFSCRYSQINITNINTFSLICGEDACFYLYDTVIGAKRSTIDCSGHQSCSDGTITYLNTSGSDVSSAFMYFGNWSAYRLVINAIDIHSFKMVCQYAGCIALELYVPQFVDIIGYDVDGIDGNIYIPISYYHEYNDSGYLNVTINHKNFYGRYIIQCIDDHLLPIQCSDWSSFPILSIAVPSMIDNSSVYYIGDEIYFYRYKQILLNNDANYYVYCNHDHSCFQTYILINNSILSISNYNYSNFIFCNGDYSCYQSLIYSITTNNISLICSGKSSCYKSVIHGSTKSNINSSMQIECKYTDSCQYAEFDIFDAKNLSIVCDRTYDACKYMNITSNAAFLNIDCNEGAICQYSMVKSTLSSSVISINCEGCVDTTFYGISDSVSLLCVQCGNAIMNISANKLYINCTLKSCGTLHIEPHEVSSLTIDCYYCYEIDVSTEVFKPDSSIYFNCYMGDRQNYDYACSGTLDATNTNLLNVTFSSLFKHEDNVRYPMVIYGPQTKNSSFNLLCIDYGCFYQDLHLLNGLDDVNVLFNGNCTCNSTSTCIKDWEIYCNNNELSSFDGNNCTDSCCNVGNIHQIQKAFDEYWFIDNHCPTIAPTFSPTESPSISPTQPPSLNPTLSPSLFPTISPSMAPSLNPTLSPTLFPSLSPSIFPTLSPSLTPSLAPSLTPTISPSLMPTLSPTVIPSVSPSGSPTISPSLTPILSPSLSPTLFPVLSPTLSPISVPTLAPSFFPSAPPSLNPSGSPLLAPTLSPNASPSLNPSFNPSFTPTIAPTSSPIVSNSSSDSFVMIGIIVGCISTFIIVVTIFLALFYVKKKKKLSMQEKVYRRFSDVNMAETGTIN